MNYDNLIKIPIYMYVYYIVRYDNNIWEYVGIMADDFGPHFYVVTDVLLINRGIRANDKEWHHLQ